MFDKRWVDINFTGGPAVTRFRVTAITETHGEASSSSDKCFLIPHAIPTGAAEPRSGGTCCSIGTELKSIYPSTKLLLETHVIPNNRFLIPHVIPTGAAEPRSGGTCCSIGTELIDLPKHEASA